MDDERTRTEADRPTAGETSADDAGDADVGLGDERPPRPPIEPEPVDPEHAVVVAVGALFTVAVIVGLV